MDDQKMEDNLDVKQDEYVKEDRDNRPPNAYDTFNFASKPASWHNETRKKLVRKIDFHLLPMLSLMFLMSYLDRSNLAQARLQGLETDLGLHGVQFNTATSILFIGYLLMQLPSNLILTKLRPSIYLPAVMLIWGCISAAQAGVQNFGGLIATRFLLGFAEAPFFPGAIFVLSTWYTREELSKRYAFFYAGPALANMFGGLIAAGVLDNLKGADGISAWRWLFIIESVVTVFLSLVSFFILPDFPGTTKWISEEERAYAQWRISVDIGEDQIGTVEPTLVQSAKLALTDYRTYLLIVMQHCVLLSQTVVFFFPSIVKTLGYGDIETLLLTCPVWASTFIVCLLVSISTSKLRERCFHIVIPMCVCIMGNILVALLTDRAPRFFAMFLMAIGAQCCFMVVLTWISNTIPRPLGKRAAVIALVNLIGNASNIYGSYLYPSSSSPQYKMGCFTVAGIGVLCITCALTLRFCLVHENKKIEEVGRRVESGEMDSTPNGTQTFKGDSERRELYMRGFRYIY